MTPADIAAEYRQAKNKKEQIKILADLNLTSEAKIRAILEQEGAIPAGERKRGNTLIDNDKAMELYLDGKDDPSIAAALGVTDGAVRAWRKRMQLNPNTKPGEPWRKPGQAARKMTMPPIDEIRAMELWNDGLDDVAIADSLGVTVTRVQNWRYRMHLMRPKGGAQRRKEKPMTESKTAENARTWDEPTEAKPREEILRGITAEPAAASTIKPMTVEQLAALFTGAAKIFGSAPVCIAHTSHVVTGAVLNISYDAENGPLDAKSMALQLEWEAT